MLTRLSYILGASVILLIGVAFATGNFHLDLSRILTVIVTTESVQVRRATETGALATFSTRANIDGAPTGTGSSAVNPAWFASVTSGTHTAKATFVSGYTVTAGYCTYLNDTTACTVTSFASVTCTATECPKTFSVPSGYTAKVEFRYTLAVPPVSVQILRTKPTGVPVSFGTRANVDASPTGTGSSAVNPAWFANVTPGTHVARATFVSGYTVTAGYCNWPEGSVDECTVTTFGNASCTSTQCARSFNAPPGQSTTVQFKYTPVVTNPDQTTVANLSFLSAQATNIYPRFSAGDLTNVTRAGTWTVTPLKIGAYDVSSTESTTLNNTLVFNITGSIIAINVNQGPNYGKIGYRIDGAAEQFIDLYASYERFGVSRTLATGLSPTVSHRVVLRVVPTDTVKNKVSVNRMAAYNSLGQAKCIDRGIPANSTYCMEIYGNPTFMQSQIVNDINFDWGTAGPSVFGGSPPDVYFAAFYRDVNIDGKNIFTSRSDDGIFVIHDKTYRTRNGGFDFIIDQWHDNAAPVSYSGARNLSGKQRLMVAYYKRPGGSGIVNVGWKEVNWLLDWNRDRKSDTAIWRPSNGTWAINLVGFAEKRWGVQGDIPVPGDYDGDRKTDHAVYQPNGNWHIALSTGPILDRQHGVPGDLPVPGDYNGDGYTDIAVYRKTDSKFYFNNVAGVSDRQLSGGTIPAPGDYDGDGKTDMAVYRNSDNSGTWTILKSSNNQAVTQSFGDSGTIPLPGDYDGDGKTDIAVYKKVMRVWRVDIPVYSVAILQSSNNTVRWQANGDSGTVPVTGDYDGDGKTDIALYRPSSGGWIINQSSNNQAVGVNYGLPPNDVALSGRLLQATDIPAVPVPPPTPCTAAKGTWKAEYYGGRVDCFSVGQDGDLLLKETFDQIAGKVAGGWEGTMSYTTVAAFAGGDSTFTITHGSVKTEVWLDGQLISTRENNVLKFETYIVTLSGVSGEHTLQIKSATQGSSRNIGIEVHGPQIWADGGVAPPPPPVPGGGGVDPISWGGSGIGLSPVRGAVAMHAAFDLSDAPIPNYPAMRIDGVPIQYRQSLDLGYQSDLSIGWHTASIDIVPGFDIWMDVCNDCFNHPLGEFAYGNSVSFYHDGGFNHIYIQYFPSGRSLNMTGIALTVDGKEIHFSESTMEVGRLFTGPRQVFRNLFTMPREYFGAISRRYIQPTVANAYATFGARWDSCAVKGQNIGTNIQAQNSNGDIPLTEQIQDVTDEWRKAGYSLIVAPRLTANDYARGALDSNGVITLIGNTEIIPAHNESLSQLALDTGYSIIFGYALIWDETGGLINQESNIVYKQIVETDILINTDFVTGYLSGAGTGFGGSPDYFNNVLMHEFGHHIGLTHSALSDLMQAGGGDNTYLKTVGPDDIRGVEELYSDCL